MRVFLLAVWTLWQREVTRFYRQPSRVVGALAPLEGAGAGGDVRNALPDNPLAETSQMLVSYVCSYYNADPGAARAMLPLIVREGVEAVREEPTADEPD